MVTVPSSDMHPHVVIQKTHQVCRRAQQRAPAIAVCMRHANGRAASGEACSAASALHAEHVMAEPGAVAGCEARHL